MSNQSRLVLSTASFPEEWLQRLERLSPELQVEQRSAHAAGEIPGELWQQVEVLYTLRVIPAPQQAPRLRWVQLHSAGADQVIDSPLFRTSVVFTTSSGVHAIPMAEYVFAMILAWFHRVPNMLDWQRRGQWPPDEQRWPLFVPNELWGKTVGIVGYGSIGRQVARVAAGFGMRVLAMQRGSDHHDHGFQFPGVGDPDGILPARYYSPDQLHAMLSESDVVIIAVPLTPQTQGLFDEAAFRAMKREAFLVNIARGEICDETALVRALTQHWIDGAALDVYAHEPLPPDSPLWRLSNVLLSPHTSGFTPHYDERTFRIFEENLKRYLSGQRLANVVDKAQQY